jgi:hypothetical protein
MSQDQLIVIFTGVLAVVAVLQWAAMLRQSRHMREGLQVNRQSAEASTRSAEAAGRAANVAEEALRKTERAYLRVTRPELVGGFEVRQPLKLEFQIENSGRTPARFKRFAYVARVAPQLPREPDYSVGQTINTFETLHPGESFGQTLQMQSLADDVLKELATGIKTFWWYGHVQYVDVFGTEHETRFVCKYNVREGRFYAAIAPDSFTRTT